MVSTAAYIRANEQARPRVLVTVGEHALEVIARKVARHDKLVERGRPHHLRAGSRQAPVVQVVFPPRCISGECVNEVVDAQPVTVNQATPVRRVWIL